MARYALNLPVKLKEEASKLAKEQGVSLNQFILWSVSEKVATMSHSLDDPHFPRITYRRGGSGVPSPVLRGRGIRVKAIVGYVNGWGMTPEKVAEELELPVDLVDEAMRFYEAHRLEIDAAIEVDRQFAIQAGYGE